MKPIFTWLRPAMGRERNPLIRRADRIEAAILCALAAAFLVAAPLLGISAGRMAYRADARRQLAEASWHQVPATVVRMTAQGSWLSPAVLATWTTPAGRPRTGTFPTALELSRGERLQIWIDAQGRLVTQPVDAWAIGRDVGMAAAAGPGLIGLVLLAAGGVVRLVANRHRMAGWDQDWSTVGPRWTRLP